MKNNQEINQVINEIKDIIEEFHFFDTGTADEQVKNLGFVGNGVLSKGNDWLPGDQIGEMKDSFFKNLQNMTPQQKIQAIQAQKEELEKTGQISSAFNPVTRVINTDSNKMREFYDALDAAENHARLEGKTGLSYGLEYTRQNILPKAVTGLGAGIGLYGAWKVGKSMQNFLNKEHAKNFQQKQNVNNFRNTTGMQN